MTILYALLILRAAVLVTTITSLYENSELRISYLTLYIHIFFTIIQYNIIVYNLWLFLGFFPFGQGDFH